MTQSNETSPVTTKSCVDALPTCSALERVAALAAQCMIDLSDNLRTAHQEYMDGKIAKGAFEYVRIRHDALHEALHAAGFTAKHPVYDSRAPAQQTTTIPQTPNPSPAASPRLVALYYDVETWEQIRREAPYPFKHKYAIGQSFVDEGKTWVVVNAWVEPRGVYPSGVYRVLCSSSIPAWMADTLRGVVGR